MAIPEKLKDYLEKIDGALQKPVISVVIPVYRCAQFLPICLTSLLKQTLVSRLEIIIVDDGNAEDISEPILWFESHLNIKLVRLEQNSGLFNARYQGAQHATSEWIYHLDPDDRLEQADYFESMLATAVGSGAEVVVSGFVVYAEKNQQCPIGKRDVLEYTEAYPTPLDYFLDKNASWNIWGKLCKTALFREIEIYQDIAKHHIVRGEDFMYSLALFLHANSIATNNEAKYAYIRHNGSNLAVKSDESIAKDIWDIHYVIHYARQIAPQEHKQQIHEKLLVLMEYLVTEKLQKTSSKHVFDLAYDLLPHDLLFRYLFRIGADHARLLNENQELVKQNHALKHSKSYRLGQRFAYVYRNKTHPVRVLKKTIKYGLRKLRVRI